MQHLLERIKAGTLWDFHGGIHPREQAPVQPLDPVVDAGLPPAHHSGAPARGSGRRTAGAGWGTRSRSNPHPF